MASKNARQNLIRILQNAHAGECAAAYAYRGHWKSLRESPEKERIREIEAEEWDHRDRVAKWLEEFDVKPRALREKLFWAIGRTIGATCFVSGWFFPMYFTGRLESGNVIEYKDAANYARELDIPDCVDDLIDMARVEAEHEAFFRQIVNGHRLLPAMKRVFGWN